MPGPYTWKYFEKNSTIISLIIVILILTIYIYANPNPNPNPNLNSLIFTGVNAVLVGTMVSFVYGFFLRKQLIEIIKEEIAKKFAPDGVEVIFPDRPELEYLGHILDAKRIRILATSLDYWRIKGSLTEALERAIKNDCQTELLFLNPESKFAERRGKDINDVFFPDDIRKSAQIIYEKLNGTGKEFSMMKYDSLPSIIMVIIDSHMYINFNIIGKRGRDTLHLKIRIDSYIGGYFENHYNMIQKSACNYSGGS